MTILQNAGSRRTTSRSLSLRIATLTAASGLALGLAACGGDDDNADGSAGGSTSSGSAAFDAVKEKAAGLNYNCVDLGDAEEPSTGLTGGLSCIPAAEKVGTDPMFVLFPTDTVASGADAAQKAVDKYVDKLQGGADSSSTLAMAKNMYVTVDGDGVAGTCINQKDNCLTTLPDFGLTADKLDGALNAEDAGKLAEQEFQQQAEEEQRESEAAEAEKTEALQTYTGWDDMDAAVEQLNAWGLRCEEPEDLGGASGTFCGDSDGPLIFGDYDKVISKLKDESGMTDEESSQVLQVSDGDWALLCYPDRPENCETVADKTGKDVEEGI